MADPIVGGPVIIRDDTGREHIFPPGFDPTRAAQIVRGQTYTPPNIRRDARGVPISESNPAEDRPIATATGRLVNSIRNPTPGVQLGMDLLPMATGALFGKPGGGPLPEQLPPAGAVKAGLKAAAMEAPIVKGPLKAGIKAYQEATSAAPKAAGAPRLVPKGIGAPALSEALQEAIAATRAAPTAETVTGTPPKTATPAGKPSVTAAEYDALQGTKAAQPNVGRVTGEVKPGIAKANGAAGGSSSQEALPTTRKTAGTKNAKIADSSSGADSLEKLQAAIHGADAPTQGNGTGGPDALKDALTELRRKFGANRIAKEINPNAQEPVVGAIVKKTGAPSAMPDIAQKALLEHLQDPTSITDPGRYHRALSQLLREYKRNGGVAGSDTARTVRDTLKKYGYDVP